MAEFLLNADFDELEEWGVYDVAKTSAGTPEITLRVAIILQAIIDARRDENSAQHYKIRKDILHARSWILGNNKYFQEICETIGIAPRFFREELRKRLENPQYHKDNRGDSRWGKK